MKDSCILPYLVWCDNNSKGVVGWSVSTTCAYSRGLISVDELIRQYKEYELGEIEMMEYEDEILY